MERDGDQTRDCLQEESDVVFTCNVTGFPHPEVIFLKDSVAIMPGVGKVASISSNQVHMKALCT